MENNDQRKAVFLDRDGTLIEEVNFLSSVDELRLFPYTFEAVKLRIQSVHGFADVYSPGSQTPRRYGIA